MVVNICGLRRMCNVEFAIFFLSLRLIEAIRAIRYENFIKSSGEAVHVEVTVLFHGFQPSAQFH